MCLSLDQCWNVLLFLFLLIVWLVVKYVGRLLRNIWSSVCGWGSVVVFVIVIVVMVAHPVVCLTQASEQAQRQSRTNWWLKPCCALNFCFVSICMADWNKNTYIICTYWINSYVWFVAEFQVVQYMHTNVYVDIQILNWNVWRSSCRLWYVQSCIWTHFVPPDPQFRAELKSSDYTRRECLWEKNDFFHLALLSFKGALNHSIEGTQALCGQQMKFQK